MDHQLDRNTTQKEHKLFQIQNSSNNHCHCMLIMIFYTTEYDQIMAATSIANENNISHVGQIIVNNLDSLDIVDADSMLSPEKHQMLNSGVGANSIPQRINEDPWFQKIIEENRMLERHIRFLRHIIQREIQRCNFKEIIVGINYYR